MSLAAAIVATAFGVIGSFYGVNWLAPWIGAATTLGAMIVAYGLLDRRQYLAATYGAMASALGRIENRYGNDDAGLAALVKATEDLLQGEHLAWTERMKQTIAAPVALASRE